MIRRREPVWIDERDALAIHGRLLAVHGGPPGLRDASLLASALARPRHVLAYSKKVDIVGMAAAHTVGIVRNHPFVDGNKRAGFVIGVLFLELDGHAFGAAEADAAQAVIALAAGELDESGCAAFMRDNGIADASR